MADLPTLTQRVNLDSSGFQSGANMVTGLFGEMESGAGKFAASAAAMGVAAVAAVGAAAVGIGIAGYKIGETFDSGFDKIRVSSGETGKALEGLQSSAKNVFQNVPESFGSVSDTISKFHQVLDLTGKPLEDISQRTLQLSHITGTDLKSNVENTAGVMKNWQIPAGQMNNKMDEMFRVSQKTGIGVDVLGGVMSKQGSTLRNAGFDFEHAASMIGLLEKNAIPVGPVMMGMNKAVGSFMKAGEDPRAKMQELLTNIRDMPDAAKAGELAMQTFGARGGPKLAEALRSGQLSVDTLAESISKGGDTIPKATAATEDFSEKFDKMKNKLMVAVEPIASAWFNMFGKGMDILSEKGGVIDKVTGFFSKPITEGKPEEIGKTHAQLMLKGLTDGFSGGSLGNLGGFGETLNHVFDKFSLGGSDLWKSLQGLFDNVNWTDVLETVKSVLNDVIPVIKQYVETWSSGWQAIMTVAARVIDVISFLWGLFGDDILQYIREAFDAIATTVGGVLEVFQGVFDIISGLFSGDWSLLWQGVQEVFDGVWQIMLGIVMAVWAEIHFYISAGVEYVMFLLQPIIDFLYSVFAPAWDFLWPIIQGAWQIIIDVISVAWSVIQVIWDAIVFYITDILIPYYQMLWSIIEIVWSGIMDAISFAWNNVIMPIWDLIVFYITGILIPYYQLLWSIVQEVWSGIMDAISVAWGIISFVFNAIVGGVQWMWGAFQYLAGIVGSVWGGIVSSIQYAWGIISGVWGTVVGFLRDTLGNAFSVFGDVARGAWDGLSTAADKALGVLKSALGPLKTMLDVMSHLPIVGSAIGSAAGALGDFINGKEAGGILLAAGGASIGGGFMTSGPQAIVGEGDPNHPEFVVPTDPKHRTNAMRLVHTLLSMLGLPEILSGVANIPGLAGGGSLNGAVDMISPGMSDWLSDLIHKLPDAVGNIVSNIVDSLFGGSADPHALDNLTHPGQSGSNLPGTFGGGKDMLHAMGGVLYDKGGILPPGATLAINNTGANETVSPGGTLGTPANPMATTVDTSAASGLQDLGTVWADQLTGAAAAVGPDVASGMQALIDQAVPVLTDFGTQSTDSMSTTASSLTSTMQDALVAMETAQAASLTTQLDTQTVNQQAMLDAQTLHWGGVTDLTNTSMDTINLSVGAGWSAMNANTQANMGVATATVSTAMGTVVSTMTTGAETAATSFVDQLNARIPPLQNTLSAYAENVKTYGRQYLQSIGAPVTFAAGGVWPGMPGTENHNAHVAHGMRTFGEPETGGEAYIPLSTAKRGRSTGILEQTAAYFGYGLIPHAKFDLGGFSLEELFWEGGTGTDWKNGQNIGRTIGGHTDHTHAGTTGAPWEAVQAYLDSVGVPARPTSTTRPGDSGLHGLGRAVDYGDSQNNPQQIYDALLPGVSGGLAAIAKAVVPAPDRASFGDGIPADQAFAMAQIMQIAMQKQLDAAYDAHISSFMGHGGIHGGAFQDYAHSLMASYGWSEADFAALVELWNRESSWNPLARNPSSGAWGIAQFLGADKGPPTDDGYAQIDMGLAYIAKRYGSPSAALAFHNAHNWYGQGGIAMPVFDSGGTLKPGANMVYNGTGADEHVVPYADGGIAGRLGLDPQLLNAITDWDVAGGAAGNIMNDLWTQAGVLPNVFGMGQPGSLMPWDLVSGAAGNLARNSGGPGGFVVGPENLANVTFTDAVSHILAAAVQSNPSLAGAFADPDVQAAAVATQEAVQQFLNDNPAAQDQITGFLDKLNTTVRDNEELRREMRDTGGLTVESMSVTAVDPVEVAREIADELAFQRLTAGI